jgi:hypothetical protein
MQHRLVVSAVILGGHHADGVSPGSKEIVAGSDPRSYGHPARTGDAEKPSGADCPFLTKALDV